VFDALQSAIRLHRSSTGERVNLPTSETLYEISVALALNIDSSKTVLEAGSVYDPTFDSKGLPAVLASLKAELEARDVATTIEERDQTNYRQQLVQLMQQMVTADVTTSSSQSNDHGGPRVTASTAKSAGPSGGVPRETVQDEWYSMPEPTPLFESPPMPSKTVRTMVFDKITCRLRELLVPSHHKVMLDDDEPAQKCLGTKLTVATSRRNLWELSNSVQREVLHCRMKTFFPNGDSPCSKSVQRHSHPTRTH
jgi:hypothetical protein